MTGRKQLLVTMAVLFAATLAFWARTVRYDFVNFDDGEYVTENDHVLGGLSWANVTWAWRDAGYAANWHPLTWMSLQADVSLTGLFEGSCREAPPFDRLSAVMHLHNALLHAANAALLFLLMWIMLESLSASRREILKVGEDENVGRSPFTFHLSSFALFALLWAVHPLRAEAVAWVSERKEVLSAFFMLLTLVCHVRGHLVAALALYALALSAKPVAVSLPAVVFALDWWREGRPRWLRAAAYAVLAAACVGLTLLAQQGAMPGDYIPFKWRLPNALASIFTYAYQTLLPQDLAAYYPFELRMPWLKMLAGAGLAYGLVRWAFRSRLGSLALAWIGVGLLPMLGIVQVGGQSHADRYTYWVGCGATAIVALALARPLSRLSETTRRIAFCLLSLAVVAYALAGWRQMDSWRNSQSLFETAYAATRSGWAAGNLADIYTSSDPTRVEPLLREAVAASENDEALAKLAYFLAVQPDRKDFGEIYALCSEAEQQDASNWQIYEARGIALVREGRHAEALPVLEKALALGSGLPVVRKMAEEIRQKMQGTR